MATRLKTTLRHPGPCLAVPGERHCAPIDSVLSRKVSIRQFARPDCSDRISVQFAEVPSTNYRIHLVVLIGSVSEMVDVDTGRVVAGVQNIQVGRPKVVLDHDSVREYRLPVDAHLSVSLAVSGTREHQTVALPFRTRHHFVVGRPSPSQNRAVKRLPLTPPHVVRRAHPSRNHICSITVVHYTCCVHDRRVQQWLHV